MRKFKTNEIFKTIECNSEHLVVNTKITLKMCGYDLTMAFNQTTLDCSHKISCL